MLAAANIQEYLNAALEALHDCANWKSVLDELPVPIYTTDAEGAVTYWNQACADFVGREPRLGDDRWCVTWQLYTMSGDPLPHDECPMARAIKEKREIRNEIIIAERPDGQRVACRPYPTPYFDSRGNLEGAVNLLIDVTHEQADALAEQASRCRRLSRATNDRQASEILASMAQGYAATANALKHAD
jgi:PAS domain S-box-containing protein